MGLEIGETGTHERVAHPDLDILNRQTAAKRIQGLLKNVDIQIQGLRAVRSGVWSDGSSAKDVMKPASDVVAAGVIAPKIVKKRESWPMTAMTDSEAAKALRGVDSGLTPNLSRRGYRALKRAFDICVSGAGIAILLIPAILLSVAICVKSPGASPLYSQIRVGRLRKSGEYSLFRMWKFRSMVPRADAMLKDLQDRNEADGPMFKIHEDPRVIPGLGRFIRKHSIDELPQLLNVFCGQMSLIGPRPALPKEVTAYDERAKRRLTVKPGCGGAWQAGNRSDSTFDEMVKLDLIYVDHCSPMYDVRLIKNTAKAMIVGNGAY